jgi:hypothetical protein
MMANATSILSQQCPQRRRPTLRDRLKSMWTSVPLSRMTRCQYNAGHLGLHCDAQSHQWATPDQVEQRRPGAYQELTD